MASQGWYPALRRRRASLIPAHLEKKTSNLFSRQCGRAASGGEDEGVRHSRSPADTVFSLYFFPVLIRKHFLEDKLAKFTLKSYYQWHKTNPDALQTSRTLTVSKYKYVYAAIGLSTKKCPPEEHPDLQDVTPGARRPGPLWCHHGAVLLHSLPGLSSLTKLSQP